ncbi:MAG: sugar ABC transporter permease [Spirochaetales bacterium]|nr:sugar ABC transporter permease [Spirochaetales bacterium]
MRIFSKKHSDTLRSRYEWALFVLLLPGLVYFLLIVAVPFFQGIPISLRKWDGFSATSEFVGLTNFFRMFRDGDIVSAFSNTVFLATANIIGSNTLGLLLAVLIKSRSRANSFVRMIVFMPFIISLVLSAIMFSYIYTDVIFPYFGIPSPLGSPRWVLTGLSVISIWRTTGYCMVIYLAALQTIPEDLMEACDIEGAGPMFKFFRITLPLITPAVTANISLLLTWGMKVFDGPMTVTGGGPGTSSVTLAMYVYFNIFLFFKAGYGQALGLAFLVIVGALSITVTRFLRSREVQL